MLFVKEVVLNNGLPPVAVAYHLIEVPVAIKLATVGEFVEQKFCNVDPVGVVVEQAINFILLFPSSVLFVLIFLYGIPNKIEFPKELFFKFSP